MIRHPTLDIGQPVRVAASFHSRECRASRVDHCGLAGHALPEE